MSEIEVAEPGDGKVLPPPIEFYRTLGIAVDSPAKGESVVEMPSSEGFRNSRGELHGGAVLSIADIAASAAARSSLSPGDGVATISLSMNFVRAAKGMTRAKGRVVSLGGRVSFVEVEVECDAQTVAHGIATIRLFRSGPAGAR